VLGVFAVNMNINPPPPFLGVVFDSGFVKIDYIYRLHVYPQKSIIHLIEFIWGEFK
jgi:hypothetical protein